MIKAWINEPNIILTFQSDFTINILLKESYLSDCNYLIQLIYDKVVFINDGSRKLTTDILSILKSADTLPFRKEHFFRYSNFEMEKLISGKPGIKSKLRDEYYSLSNGYNC